MSQLIDSVKPGEVVFHIDSNKPYTVKDVNPETGYFSVVGYENQGRIHRPEYYKRPEQPKVAKWKIESDGTKAGTKVWINGQEQPNVYSIDFSCDIDGLPVLKLSLTGER